MQQARLFEIVYLLMNRKTTTAKALADHFEVSVRTIHRDIDVLIQSGIPLYTTRGRGGGISLMDGFVFNKATLSEAEQQEILMSLKSLSATGAFDPGTTLSKLGALFDGASTDWIEVDFSRWGQTAQDNSRFEILKSSILEQTAIRFEYVDSGGASSSRTVYPLKLVFKSRAWYLQGFCLGKNDYRTFKINRILNLEHLDETFDRKSFTPPPIERSEPGSVERELVEFVVASKSAYRTYDEFDEGCIDRLEDGSVHVCVRVPVDDWLQGFLRGLGSDVEIMQPSALRDCLGR